MKKQPKKSETFVGEASIDVRQLVERMKNTACGEVVGYRELSQLIGRDVTVHRHLIESARRGTTRRWPNSNAEAPCSGCLVNLPVARQPR
jgi:hypothetical protein